MLRSLLTVLRHGDLSRKGDENVLWIPYFIWLLANKPSEHRPSPNVVNVQFIILRPYSSSHGNILCIMALKGLLPMTIKKVACSVLI